MKDNYDYIKTYCGIPLNVTLYDETIKLNKEIALTRLAIAGVSTNEENLIVQQYISTFCRFQLVSEPTSVFVKMETDRMREMIELLTYGGVE
ncbi:hypothetical protein [Lactococcus lactis]|uniref:hypothetical protein n=1 Tax=Lactococcus lactis TaxID=1358 RepID=UPI00071C8CFD|nr:hypothetical protein [Lactococcus lactis]KST92184.1 Phage protein [Lactococcus lactis subsp. lactis]